MKASDICVGDWLNIYNFPNDNPKQDDLFPAKVSAVSIFGPFKDPYDVVVELVIPNTNGIASRPLDTCLPIKLTEEILVKNGFEDVTEEGDRIRLLGTFDENDNLTFVNLYPATIGYGTDIPQLKVYYVHQLQHLLRLCGIEKEIEL